MYQLNDTLILLNIKINTLMKNVAFLLFVLVAVSLGAEERGSYSYEIILTNLNQVS